MENKEEYKLIGKRVRDVFMDCCKEDHDEIYVRGEGIDCDVFFNPQKLETYKYEILQMLEQLPEQFQQKAGGGRFLDAHMDKHGSQWVETDQVLKTTQQLFQLGSGIGKVELLMPQINPDLLLEEIACYIIMTELVAVPLENNEGILD